MSMITCPTIGKANVQRVFAEIEDVSGVLQKPTAQGFIAPAGQASLSQTPGYANSEELSETLDVIDQFQDAVGPGEASVPAYIRMPSDGSRMQGHALLLAAMGKVQEGGIVTGKTTANYTAGATSITIDQINGGDFPMRGVVTIEDEKIRYTSLTKNVDGTVALSGLARGYAGTVAASHDLGSAATLQSRVYSQAICRPTVSVWLQMDHTVVFGSGGVVTQVSIPMSNTGGQRADYSLQFRRMGWAGRSFLDGSPSGGSLMVVTSDNKNATDGYTEGAYIKNTTRSDDNSGAGYRITAVDSDSGTIAVTPTPVDWQDDDQIDAWLPDAAPVGAVIESREARVFIDGATGKLTEGSISLGTPTAFASEIGDEYPGENADTKRELTIDSGMYMRAKDVTEIGRGYKGYEVPIAVVLGNKAGASLALAMPRVKLNTPEMNADSDFITLKRTGAIMGTKGEDSLTIIQE